MNVPGGSLPTTVQLTKDAAEAGATHALVICPGKFAILTLLASRRRLRKTICCHLADQFEQDTLPFR